MYFNTNLSVTIAGKLITTVVSVKANNDGKVIGRDCDIVVPLNCRISYKNPNNETVFLTAIPTTIFKSGDPVTVTASYDGYTTVNVFSGFIYDFIEGMPLTIKCLDYVYFFKIGVFGNTRLFGTKGKNKKITSIGNGVNYKSITLKQLLENLIDFVNETIQNESPTTPPVTLMLPTMDMTLVNLTFISMSPAAILEWIKKQVGFNITLFGNQLYVNLASVVINTVQLNTGRNVIDSKLQRPLSAFQKLRLKVWFIQENGTKDSFEIGDETGEQKEVFFYKVQRSINNYENLAEQALLKFSQHKFNGELETLLYPECDLFWDVAYTDLRYPDKNGNYTVIGTEIELSPKGFHRRHKLAFVTDLNTN